MIDYQRLLDSLVKFPKLHPWSSQLPAQIKHGLCPSRWGDIGRWQNVLDQLPDLVPSTLSFANGVHIGEFNDCSSQQRDQLKTSLMALHPWRKGPYQLFGLHIDTEWRSDWKWLRLLPAIEPLQGRLVLDVGCGNGYHCWRMAGEGARQVIGIDPAPRFVYQFHVLKHFATLLEQDIPVDVLPVGIEALPSNLEAFDTVFSMGILYHRRSPEDHLRELRGALRAGGQLVLETLIIDGENQEILIPEGRYGKMRNVWAIPCHTKLLGWLNDCGFTDARCVDISPTTIDEQRSTEWMTFESLVDFLDPTNPALTIEGHPAPLRAIFTATA